MNCGYFRIFSTIIHEASGGVLAGGFWHLHIIIELSMKKSYSIEFLIFPYMYICAKKAIFP